MKYTRGRFVNMPQHVSKEQIKEHSVTLNQTLHENALTLLPLCDAHLPFLVRWNQNPEIIRWVEVNPAGKMTEEEIRNIYVRASMDSLCFLIVYQNQPVGECWLQPAHIWEADEQEPGLCPGRIDLMVGEEKFQNAGIGTAVVAMLTEYAFANRMYEILYGFTRADNMRSRMIFRKNGYQLLKGGNMQEQMGKGETAFCCYGRRLQSNTPYV